MSETTKPDAVAPIPAHWCKIVDPNAPVIQERFSCNDCGENFITMCDYMRIRKALAQAEQRAEKAEVENTRLREALKYYADDSNSISANKFTIVDEKGHFIAPFSSFGERARAALNPPGEQTDANTEN